MFFVMAMLFWAGAEISIKFDVSSNDVFTSIFILILASINAG
jgi:hypothetical protein